jgi:acetolactate synthase regulatory subunit
MSRIELGLTIRSALNQTELIRRVLQLCQQRGMTFLQVAETKSISVAKGN